MSKWSLMKIVYNLHMQVKLTNKAYRLLESSYRADEETKKRVEKRIQDIMARRQQYVIKFFGEIR